MKYSPLQHLARYGFNVKSNANYRQQVNDRSERNRLGQRAPGSELVSSNLRGTGAYLQHLQDWHTTITHGDEARVKELTAREIKKDAKSGAWALVRRAALVGAGAVVVLAWKDMYDASNAEAAAQGGLVAMGLGKLALGPEMQPSFDTEPVLQAQIAELET